MKYEIKRNDFTKIVKMLSFWKIDRRKGNYELVGGKKLKDYLFDLVQGFCLDNSLAFGDDGHLHYAEREKASVKMFYFWMPKVEETTSYEQVIRIERFISEMLY